MNAPFLLILPAHLTLPNIHSYPTPAENGDSKQRRHLPPGPGGLLRMPPQPEGARNRPGGQRRGAEAEERTGTRRRRRGALVSFVRLRCALSVGVGRQTEEI